MTHGARSLWITAPHGRQEDETMTKSAPLKAGADASSDARKGGAEAPPMASGPMASAGAGSSPAAAGGDAYARTIPSPLGALWLAVDGEGRALSVEWDGAEALELGLQRRSFRQASTPTPAGAAGLDRLAAALARYFEGDVLAPLAIGVTAASAFRRGVLGALNELPAGTCTSYGALAVQIGAKPGAARAVGGAVGSNPLPIVIPCHRVLQADGTLGGFSGGLDRKRWLLRHEGLSWREG